MKEKFDSYFEKLLRRDDPESYLLYAFLKRTLKQFHLDKFYEPNDILNEVYCRTIKALEKGTIIHSFSGWVRATGFNCVREFSRKEKKK